MLVCRRGVALATVVFFSLLLFILAACVTAFALPRKRGHDSQQRVLQASWNARAGIEAHLAGKLPEPDRSGEARLVVDPSDSSQVCLVRWERGDLLLVGVCGQVQRRLVLPKGSPRGMYEEVAP